MLDITRTAVGDQFICKIPTDLNNSDFYVLHNAQVVVSRIERNKGDKKHPKIFIYAYKDGKKSVETLLPEYSYVWMHFTPNNLVTPARMHRIEETDIHKALSDLDAMVGQTYMTLDIKLQNPFEAKIIKPLGRAVMAFYEAYNTAEIDGKLKKLNDLRITLSYLSFNLQSLVTMRVISPHGAANIVLFLNNIIEQVTKWETSLTKKQNSATESNTVTTNENSGKAGVLSTT